MTTEPGVSPREIEGRVAKEMAGMLAANPGLEMRAVWESLIPAMWKGERESARRHILGISEAAAGRFFAGHGAELDQEQRELLEKIQKLASDRSLDARSILDEARGSDVVLSMIQKNPTKQGLYEAAVCFYLNFFKREPPVEGFRVVRAYQLSKHAISLRFDGEGRLSAAKAKNGTTKSADLAVLVQRPTGSSWLLLTHKFGRVAGGHQDNQLADAVSFATNACKSGAARIPGLDALEPVGLSAENPWAPGILCDGSFFESKIPSTRAQFLGTRAWIGSTDDLAAGIGLV